MNEDRSRQTLCYSVSFLCCMIGLAVLVNLLALILGYWAWTSYLETLNPANYSI